MESYASGMFETALGLARRQRRFLEATWFRRAPAPGWTTSNRVVLDDPVFRLREFGISDPPVGSNPAPVLVVPPEVNRSSIVDFAPGQSLVRSLLDGGFQRVAAVDWRSATEETSRRTIDDSLAVIHRCIEALGGRVHLVGVCQGGWESAVAVALEPAVAASLSLVAAPIDFHAGAGLLQFVARWLPLSFYQSLVGMGGGRVRGEWISMGFDNLAPTERYWLNPLGVWNHLDDAEWLARYHRLADWYRAKKDLPGPMYLSVVEDLFKENRLIRGSFEALGRRVDLGQITCPLALVAGTDDHITPPAQVWAAGEAVGSSQVLRVEIPAGHVGTFMGRAALSDHWPGICSWLLDAIESGEGT